jgi:hypothetical protein
MNGKIVLKRPSKSKKFNIMFPKNIELNCFVDDEMRIFAEHPTDKNVYIRVSEFNIKSVVWNKSKI